jgi:hypothetical protein
MTGPEVMDVARDAIVTLILVTAPLMIVGLVVGVVVSLFQALTQIQEATLVFIPKNPGDLRDALADAAVHGRRAARKFHPHHVPHHRQLAVSATRRGQCAQRYSSFLGKGEDRRGSTASRLAGTVRIGAGSAACTASTSRERPATPTLTLLLSGRGNARSRRAD